MLIPYNKYQQLMKREAIEKITKQTPPGIKETQQKNTKGIRPPPGKREPSQKHLKATTQVNETMPKQQKKDAVPWITL